MFQSKENQHWFFSVLNSADSEKIRADQLWNRVDQRWCLSCSLNQRWKTSKLWNSAVQRGLPLGLQPGWTRRMQFWQPCWNVFDKKPKVYRSKSKSYKKSRIFQKKTLFSAKCSSGGIECIFDNPARNFSPKIWKFCLEVRK